MHGFRDNDVLVQAGYGVIVISPHWFAICRPELLAALEDLPTDGNGDVN